MVALATRGRYLVTKSQPKESRRHKARDSVIAGCCLDFCLICLFGDVVTQTCPRGEDERRGFAPSSEQEEDIQSTRGRRCIVICVDASQPSDQVHEVVVWLLWLVSTNQLNALGRLLTDSSHHERDNSSSPSTSRNTQGGISFDYRQIIVIIVRPFYERGSSLCV